MILVNKPGGPIPFYYILTNGRTCKIGSEFVNGSIPFYYIPTNGRTSKIGSEFVTPSQLV